MLTKQVQPLLLMCGITVVHTDIQNHFSFTEQCKTKNVSFTFWNQRPVKADTDARRNSLSLLPPVAGAFLVQVPGCADLPNHLQHRLSMSLISQEDLATMIYKTT